MKQANRHITGTELGDALAILQTLAETGASGIFRSDLGGLRMRRGRIVQVDDRAVRGLIQGANSNWSWRAVRGEPNGRADLDFSILLLSFGS